MSYYGGTFSPPKRQSAPDVPENTTYKSAGVHQNRDRSAKMQVEPMDREGITDSAKQANIAAAAEASANIKADQTIAVDEPMFAKTAQPDVAQKVMAQGQKAQHKATERVEAPGYKIPYPGMGNRSSFGNEGTQDNPTNTETEMDPMAMMGGGMGGGGGEGGGGGGMPAGMAEQIGSDTAAIDDEIDRANEQQFQDDTDMEAHFALNEAMQGR